MGEGPKDLRDDAGRFDAPRNDDMMGRGDSDVVGRATAGVEPLTRTSGAYPPAATRTAVGDTDYAAGAANAASTPEMAEIRAEIEQKRADISETIDEITERLSPGNLVSQATDSVKDTARSTMRRVTETAGQTATQVADSTRRAGRTAVYQVSEHPWSAGAILAGVGAATWWMMSRRSSGVEEWDVDDYTEESLYYDEGGFDVDRGNRLVNVVRDNPVPIALTTIGLGWWMWNQRARGRRVTDGSAYPASSLDTASDQHGYGAAGADAGAFRRFDNERGVWVGGEEPIEGTTERLKQAVSEATDRARETMDDVTERTREAASRAQRQIGQYSRQAKSQLQYWMEHNPLAVGAVAMAVGAAVGLALPETRREQQLMGDARDRVVGNARELANQAVDRATQAAHTLVGAAKDAASTTSSTAATASNAINRASQAAKDTLNRLD